MTYCRTLFLALLAISANAYAFKPKVEIIEQFDNLRMVAFISEKAIENSPEWNPNVEAPPLSIREAILAVKEFSKGSTKSKSIREIELRPIQKYETHWHYLIKLDNAAKNTKYDIYVVLMDGTIVPAIIEPQGYK